LKLWKLLAVCLAFAAWPAWAGEDPLGTAAGFGPHPAGTLAWASDSSIDLQAELLFNPIGDHWVEMGPRLGVAQGFGNAASRQVLHAGGEATVWLMNAIGPGIGIDASRVAPGNGGDATWGYRLDGFVGLRLFRLSTHGAFGIRGGVQYESQVQWAAKVGLSLQLSGVDL
jgi:hypothetical protein